MAKTRQNVIDAIKQAGDSSSVDLSGWDLQNADLSDLNLHRTNLSRANLEGANLTRSYLREAVFSNANLKNVNLSASYLYLADFTQSNLESANFSYADLERANFIGVTSFNETQFKMAFAAGYFGDEADLSNTDFSQAILSYEYLPKNFLQARAYRAKHNSRPAYNIYTEKTILPFDFKKARYGHYLRAPFFEKLVNCTTEFDPDIEYPLPNFLELLSIAQKEVFLTQRDAITQCVVSLDRITIPFYIEGESGNYNATDLHETLAHQELQQQEEQEELPPLHSPLTRKEITLDQVKSGYNPKSYTEYDTLIKETRQLISPDKLTKIAQSPPHSIRSNKTNTINVDTTHLYMYIVLEKYGLCNSTNIAKILKDSPLFYEQYQVLKDLGFKKTAYVAEILEHLDSINQFQQLSAFFSILNEDVPNHNPTSQQVRDLLAKRDKLYPITQKLTALNLNTPIFHRALFYKPELMPQVEQYKDQLTKLNQYELHEERYIDIVLTHPGLFATSYHRLEDLGLNNQTCVTKLLDNLQQFNQDHNHLQSLRALYGTIAQDINDDHFKVHGLKGGSTITFQGEQKIVPKGVSKI
ncbi:pentapeptide repeat-containing protein [Piscirickettsia salmonis]|uniref:pentapeptide repeat-containing protein n=1 Tax=Piscirickettsia salmonis TaxID=1238 RepID=UPI0007C962FF|nr:Serine/threonine-protein kinase B [Piscirickettsiaceae bacterium NZ-RLO1]